MFVCVIIVAHTNGILKVLLKVNLTFLLAYNTRPWSKGDPRPDLQVLYVKSL